MIKPPVGRAKPQLCENMPLDNDTGKRRRCKTVAAWTCGTVGLKLCDECRVELIRTNEFDLRFADTQLKLLRKAKPLSRSIR